MNDSACLKHFKLEAYALRCRCLLGGFALGIALLLTTATTASAQAAYGSYIGVGGSIGVSGSDSGDDVSGGGVIAARYRFLRAPISLRGQVLISDSTAFVPTISYDIPLSWQTDAYLGVGAAIQDSNTSSSPVGNQTAFVLQPGIDHVFPDSNVVLFGNAIIAFDAYKNSNDTAAAIQAGVGVNFGR
jgi:hypothetical protein